jgi:hypothetical protein
LAAILNELPGTHKVWSLWKKACYKWLLSLFMQHKVVMVKRIFLHPIWILHTKKFWSKPTQEYQMACHFYKYRMAFLTLGDFTSTKRFCWFIKLGLVWLNIIWFLRRIVRRTHMAHVKGMIFEPFRQEIIMRFIV